VNATRGGDPPSLVSAAAVHMKQQSLSLSARHLVALPPGSVTVSEAVNARDLATARASCLPRLTRFQLALGAATFLLFMLLTWLAVSVRLHNRESAALATLTAESLADFQMASARLSERVAALPTLAQVFMGRHNRTHPISDAELARVASSFAFVEGHALGNVTVAYAVSNIERAEFERLAGSSIAPFLPFVPGKGTPVRDAPFEVDAHSEYFPVVAHLPPSPETLFGDLSRGPSLHATISAALASSLPVMHTPTVGMGGGVSVLPFVQAIPSTAGKPYEGFVVVTMAFGALSTLFAACEDAMYDLHVEDVTDPTMPLVVHSNMHDHGMVPYMLRGDALTMVEYSFSVANRKWRATSYTGQGAVDELALDGACLNVFWICGTATGVVAACIVAYVAAAVAARRRDRVQATLASVAATTHESMLRLMNHGTSW